MSPIEFAALANAVTLSAFAKATPGLHAILEDKAVDDRLPLARVHGPDEVAITMPATHGRCAGLVLRAAGRDMWLVVTHVGADGPFPAGARHGVTEIVMSRDNVVDRLRRYATTVGDDVMTGSATGSRRAA